LKRGRYTHLNSDLTTEERYSPEIAQQRYEENLKAKGGELKIGNDYELSAFIEKKIGEEGYSPAAVVGEIKRLGLTFKTEISEKTIYNYIDKGIFYGISRESLPEHGERKRKYDKVDRKKAARAPQGESIEERPQEINDRQTFGHWEGDCVCGKKRTKETLFVLSERLTRNEIIIKMPDQTAASVVAALNKLERRFGKKFSQIFKSITFDNGSEFMDCAGIEKSIYGKDRKRTKVYYCHPYSAYERGTNENINKMIRRFLPKGTDFRKVTAAYIQRVETWINNYPREILGFETSGSLFERYVAEAA
jgi:IS30 family transposase